MSEVGFDSQEVHQLDNESKLENFSERLNKSDNLKDLRLAWQEIGIGDDLAGYVGAAAHEKFNETLRQTIERLGIDLNLDDERVVELSEAMSSAGPDKFGRYEYGLHSPTMTAFYRILTGCDVEVQTGLKLKPLEALVEKSIPNLGRVAMEYTKDNEYSKPSYYPRKAGRSEINIESPFWGFVVSTDSYPGTHVSIHVPTGLIAKTELINLESSSFGKKHISENPTQRRFCAQLVLEERLNYPSIKLDTSSGSVANFVKSITS
jgi:hypothetical protein